MRTTRIIILAAFALTGCAQSGAVNDVDGGGGVDGGGTKPDGGGAACVPCTTDTDCNGGICSQFASDTFCASSCGGGATCASGTTCTPVSTATGDQAEVCIPNNDACGVSVTQPDGGAPPSACAGLADPSTAANCTSCTTSGKTCQTNGCYGGWWCNTLSDKCQAPPASCSGPDAGAPFDAGGVPVTGTIGPNGGATSRLYFGVIGDTRPPVIDDTKGYPTAIITKLFQDVQALNPSPPFVVSTGDYMFASTSGGQAAPQLALYQGARAKYSGIQFPAMGNHECTGATTSNCGPNGQDGLTDNYNQFMSSMIGPIQKSKPYYSVNINDTNGKWTSKFVFIAANAWDSAQASWLTQTLSVATTYTFVVRHEPKLATTAPGVSPSEQIMAQYPYTLAIVGHTHTYGKTGTKQVTIGNGGAPLTGAVNYGYALLQQRSDNAIQVDMIDIISGQPDLNFRFAVHPDGTAAP